MITKRHQVSVVCVVVCDMINQYTILKNLHKRANRLATYNVTHSYQKEKEKKNENEIPSFRLTFFMMNGVKIQCNDFSFLAVCLLHDKFTFFFFKVVVLDSCICHGNFIAHKSSWKSVKHKSI